MEFTDDEKKPLGQGDDLDARLAQCNVRKALATVRQRWGTHGPASPMCLDEVIDGDLTIAEFCVLFLLAQRSRRNGAAVILNGAQ